MIGPLKFEAYNTWWVGSKTIEKTKMFPKINAINPKIS